MLDRRTERREFVPPPVEGGIEVICGSMFSGKSEELIRRCKRAQIARLEVQVFKPELDDRRGETVNSYNGNKIEAISVKSSDGIIELLKPQVNVLAVDEVQFFDEEILQVLNYVASRGVRVIVAGLNIDFRGEVFGVMDKLMCTADHVDTFHAICVKCGGDASRTQRMIKERSIGSDWVVRPANYEDPLILVGGAESETSNGGKEYVEYYEARCRKHHEVPRKGKQF